MIIDPFFLRFSFILLGAKSRNFHPYQCPSPKMAQKSAGAFMESFQNRISDMYRLKSQYYSFQFSNIKYPGVGPVITRWRRETIMTTTAAGPGAT